MGFAVIVLLGLALGWLGREYYFRRLQKAYGVLQGEYQTLQSEHQALMFQHQHHQQALLHAQASFAKEKAFFEERVSFLQSSHQEKVFKEVCSQAFWESQKNFLQVIQPVLNQVQERNDFSLKEQQEKFAHLAVPLEKHLKDVVSYVQQLEKERTGAYESMRQQILFITEGQKRLTQETQNLATALRTPHIRGCWGEMQLRRVVELAGMLPHCDFQEQVTLTTETSKSYRPDMIIHLHHKRCLFVDAKAPLVHYLDALSTDEMSEYKKKMQDHGRALLSYIRQLSGKMYWHHQDQTVEFVLLFLPGESFLSAALEALPHLVEEAAHLQVILATPTILIALLKTIAQGWRHEQLSRETQNIIQTARRLQIHTEGLVTLVHTLGKQLRQLGGTYEKTEKLIQNTLAPLIHGMGCAVDPSAVPAVVPVDSVVDYIVPTVDPVVPVDYIVDPVSSGVVSEDA